MKERPLKLSIQHFAGTPPTAPPSTTPATPPETPPAPAPKTFTQEDVNAIASRESKSAVEKLLKEAGIAPEGDYKAAMQAFKAWQDSQKTELEKATGSLTTAQKAQQEAEAKATALERRFEAVKQGVPVDKADKYIKLAEAYTTDTVDFTKALELALKDFPVAESGTPGAGGNPPPAPNGKKLLPSGTVIF